MPLQNIAVVYQYKNEYQNAIDAYHKLSLVDDINPEIYYGIGNIYATALGANEKVLDYMCKVYNLYIEPKSAYRIDAENMIQLIYIKMKENHKEDEFLKKKLKENNITPEKK